MEKSGQELASCKALSSSSATICKALEIFQQFKHPDATKQQSNWTRELAHPLPAEGEGLEQVLKAICDYVIPNGSTIPNPGSTAFITTGATTSAVIASFCSSVASPQRYGITAFNYLEELSLQWLKELFDLPQTMQGVYSSGGSTANVIGLGSARQYAFESIGINPSEDGVTKPCRIYASTASHKTIHRAAAVLGLGRKSVVEIPIDTTGRLNILKLEEQINNDKDKGFVQVAIVANIGTTDTGAIDPLSEISYIAQKYKIWLHADGAYGLPGLLDPALKSLYTHISHVDSVTVDPHKWLGAAVGIGATFVKDAELLRRAFSQGKADYLEGASANEITHSLSSFGTPYFDYGLELSAPCRGIVVWAILKEVGKAGLSQRVCRHNAMARYVAKRAVDHPNLELILEPTLSICCFRFVDNSVDNLNALNKRIYHILLTRGKNMPSTTMIEGKLVLRPCFIGAQTNDKHAQNLVDEILEIGLSIVKC